MQLKVETSELTKAANDIEELVNDYMLQYNQFYETAASLQGEWQGEDTTAFLNKIEEFKEDFVKMSNLINDYVQFLRTSANAYENCQTSILDSINRLRG